MAHQVDTQYTSENRSMATDDRSLGELFADLSRETTTLVREEVALAKAEMSHKASAVGKDIGYLGAGGAVLYAGFLALIAAAIIGLGQLGLTWWLSAAIVGLIVAGAGAFLVVTGIGNLKRTSLAPTTTVETLKEDAKWAKDQI